MKAPLNDWRRARDARSPEDLEMDTDLHWSLTLKTDEMAPVYQPGETIRVDASRSPAVGENIIGRADCCGLVVRKYEGDKARDFFLTTPNPDRSNLIVPRVEFDWIWPIISEELGHLK